MKWASELEIPEQMVPQWLCLLLLEGSWVLLGLRVQCLREQEKSSCKRGLDFGALRAL